MKSNTKKLAIILQALLLLVASVLLLLPNARAADITFRSVTISTAIPAAQATQTFSFSLPTTSLVGSIEFENCTNSPLFIIACIAPAGLSLNTAILATQTNNTGFTIDGVNSTSNRLVITRAPSNGNLGATTYSFTGVVNPNTTGQTVFVRIATHATIDGTGPRIDTGSVAYSIQSSFSIGAFVPPFLIFCAGITVALDCSSTGGLLINFGELSTINPNSATSQFSGATNDPGGYNVFLFGQTMTAGNQIINPLAVNSGSIAGTGQFGINLRSNVSPVVGSDPIGIGTAAPTPNYNIPNSYRFNSGDQLVGTNISTDYNLHTVSYIVNVGTSQQAGYYATTMTYIAVAAF